MTTFNFHGFDGFEHAGSGLGAFFGIFAGVLIVFCVIMFALGILMYVFESLGLYTVAKRRGIKCYGLSWVPVGNLWIIGKLADQFDNYKNGKNIKLSLILLIGGIATFVMAIIITIVTIPSAIALSGATTSQVTSAVGAILIIDVLLWIIAVATAVFEFIALYKIYMAATPNSAVVLLVLSIIFSVIIPFVLFANRKKDDGFIQVDNDRKAAQQAPAQPLPQFNAPAPAQEQAAPSDNAGYQNYEYTQPQQPAQPETPAAPEKPEAPEAPEQSSAPDDNNGDVQH